MKCLLPVVALIATAFSNSAPSARFPELRLTMETDTLRVHPPKGFLKPTDNLIDSVLALPEEYFALNVSPADDYRPGMVCCGTSKTKRGCHGEGGTTEAIPLFGAQTEIASLSLARLAAERAMTAMSWRHPEV